MHARQSRLAVLVGTVLILLGRGQIARAQGFIIDRRPHVPVARSYEIREVAHRRPGPRPGGRGPGLPDVPQPRVVPDRVGIPLPAARGRRGPELRAAGRRPRAARPAHEQGRGPADLRGDRPHQARPGPAGIHGPRALSHQRLPDPARGRPQGHDAVHPALQARPRRRRVLLSAQHPEVHGQADPAAGAQRLDPEQGRDQVDLLPERRRPDRPRRRPRGHGSASNGATSSRAPTSAWSTRWPRGRSGPRSSATGRATATTAISCSWPAPRSRPPTPGPSPRRSSSCSTARARWPARRSSRPARP